MAFSLSGLASGFDWQSLVDQLVEVERVPQQRLLTEQNLLNQRNNAYTSVKTQLSTLNTRINTLKGTALFDSRAANSSSTSIATASVLGGAPIGQFKFNVSQLATTAKQVGASNVGATLNATNDVSGLTLANAKFSTAVTAGTISVNGKQITLATSDTLQDVFNRISTATSGVVTGSYDASTDKISLTASSGEVVLGSATDTSNFLSVARLNNNGTGTSTSTASLGGLKLTGNLNVANFATALSDGGSGAGAFKINGVSISFNASSDSLTNVMDRINSSAAGVSASYDAVNDRITMVNKVTGDLGVAMEDVTGNFLAAAGLTGGTLERGKDLIYQINDGPNLVSHSNTITETSSGLTGLTVNALATGTVNVTVSQDTAKIKSAINDFIGEFNKAQSVIDTQTASTTDAKGKVTAGTLANDSDAYDIAATLRSRTNNTLSGMTGTIRRMDDLGITSNGNNNSLTLSDESALNEALANNLEDVKRFFTDATSGLAVKLSAFMDKTIGENGTVTTKQSNLTVDAGKIDTQILDLERAVQSNRQRLVDSFVNMETAQAKIKQQLQFLSQKFGGTTS